MSIVKSKLVSENHILLLEEIVKEGAKSNKRSSLNYQLAVYEITDDRKLVLLNVEGTDFKIGPGIHIKFGLGGYLKVFERI